MRARPEYGHGTPFSRQKPAALGSVRAPHGDMACTAYVFQRITNLQRHLFWPNLGKTAEIKRIDVLGNCSGADAHLSLQADRRESRRSITSTGRMRTEWEQGAQNGTEATHKRQTYTAPSQQEFEGCCSCYRDYPPGVVLVETDPTGRFAIFAACVHAPALISLSHGAN